MKKKIINGLLFAVALVAATSSFVSCKDYEGDNYAELQEKYATLEKVYNTQVQEMENYLRSSVFDNFKKNEFDKLVESYLKANGYEPGGGIESVKDFVESQEFLNYMQKWGISGYDASKGTIANRLEELEKDTASLAERIAKNNLAIAQAKGLAERDSVRLDELDNLLGKLVAYWGDDLNAAVEKAAEVLITVAKDSAKWNEAYDSIAKNAQSWNDVRDYVLANQEKWNEAYDSIAKRSKEWNRAVAVADSAYNFIHNNYKGEFKNLQELIDAYKAADEALQEQIDDLKADVEKILKALRTEITGITVQAAVNPIFGSFAYPVDVQSNVLAVYYGEVEEAGYDFPAGDEYAGDLWANGNPAILRSELDEINPENVYHVKSGILMNEDAGNAGKLYVTVNPSNVDFDGKFFTLRTSDNQVSKVTLSALEPCTEQLKWGSQRASANGFYVANAKIDEKDVKAVTLSLDMDSSQIKNDVKNIMSDWSKTGVADVAKLALTVVSGMKADVPRLGVQAQWQDATTGDWKNYVSKYDLAAFSVKPFGFGILQNDYSEVIVKLQDKITAKEKAFSQELMNMIAGAINVEIGLPATSGGIVTTPDDKVFIKIGAGQFGTFGPVTITKGQFGSIEVPVLDGEGYPTGTTKTQYIPESEITLDIADPDVVTSLGLPTDDAYIEITPLFNAIKNGLEGALSGVDGIGGKVEQVLNKIINIQNKIFAKVASVAKNPNRFLQPALIAQSKNVYFYPSRMREAPTKVKVEKGGTLKLYPTTLTGETVIPAFKKYVAVCGAWDAKDKNKTYSPKKFNTDESYMNKVIDGSMSNLQKPFEYKIPENTPAGTVLEIIYECLDYTGKVAGKKYYIEVAY